METQPEKRLRFGGLSAILVLVILAITVGFLGISYTTRQQVEQLQEALERSRDLSQDYLDAYAEVYQQNAQLRQEIDRLRAQSAVEAPPVESD